MLQSKNPNKPKPPRLKPPTQKQLEDALIKAGIAQSHPDYLGGQVAFVCSPRIMLEIVFDSLCYTTGYFGEPLGISQDELWESYPSLDENREIILKAIEIARSIGWDEFNGGISDEWKWK